MSLSRTRILTAGTVLSVAAVVGGGASAQATSVLSNGSPVGSQPPPVQLSHQLWAWGNNSDYALGDGTTTNRLTPVRVPGMIHVVSAAPGIAAKDDGTVWVWGDDRDGELGTRPSATAKAKTPVQVPGLTGVVSVASRNDSRYALKFDGTLWDWGSDNLGNLGDDRDTGADTPHQVLGISDVTQVVAGEGFAYVREADGSIWGWGDMVMDAFQPLGDLDNPSLVPIQLDNRPDDPFPAGVSSLGAGTFNAVGVYSGGKVWTFGNDDSGQAGDGSLTTGFSMAGSARNITTATQATAGGYSVYALLTSGRVMAWGDNFEGELGAGSTVPRSEVPVAVKGLTGVTAIAGGTDAGYAISGGTIYAWGANYSGDLGDGTTTMRRAPVPLGLLAPTLITAGNETAFAVAGYF